MTAKERREKKEIAKECLEPAFEYLEKLAEHRKVRLMDTFIQHGNVTTLEHCRNVAKTSYKLSKALKLRHIEHKKMLRAALLHDFYLYDWHEKGDGSHKWHGFHHAERARRNAVKFFNISPKEQDIIASHMWPLNITKIPKSREAWLVCIADKIEATKETLFKR